MAKKIKLTFCSGTGSVTGANFLLEWEDKKILIDCGLIQGSKLADEENWKPFSYQPSSIDSLIITHAHLDHVGRIPKLIKEGFKGKIFSTPPTKDLAQLMLEDSVQILSRDRENQLNLIYNKKNIDQAISQWEGVPYHQLIDLGKGLSISLKNTGHILGSAMVEILYNGKKLIFSSDLGHSPSPLLPPAETIDNADYLIIESVYGDRTYGSRELRRSELKKVIEDNCKSKGILIIPIFSLERTQELLFEINGFVENNQIPRIPIFLDSPLAIQFTKVYENYKKYFNKKAQALINSGDDIFDFPGLQLTLMTKESKLIYREPNPKIIIAGSGMSTGGRIIVHERDYLSDPKNTLLLVGYQSLGTLGRIIQDGAKEVFIFKKRVPVRAKIVTIRGYSGHKDSDGLLKFVQQMEGKLKQVFVVMGEPKSSLFLAQRIRDNLNIKARSPKAGESVELEF
ncbi:hypothetical protein A2995_00305 [Candidatus Nomurabacteria bacterium RIFCSPLOWO2_01_FULL_33_24]|uniref:MBL fold hydrolase n=1 Tax=Candidatus Nomurabacteria bacterium RIFCSPLOWO2_01_FULL_33_24 TaxID=1801765 RepID=A0A1F6X246_9BACT|nr:MAG: hypothetical protein A2995_00305 [Candidatus Nomurabacteria bacterium RIFCSPLOWO2_01_FULL_33_24]